MWQKYPIVLHQAGSIHKLTSFVSYLLSYMLTLDHTTLFYWMLSDSATQSNQGTMSKDVLPLFLQTSLDPPARVLEFE